MNTEMILFASGSENTPKRLEKLKAVVGNSCFKIVTIVPLFVGTCDIESLVASGHKKICDFCDFKDVVAFGNNQLWRPLAAKVQGHHSGLLKNMVSLVKTN